VSDSFQADTDAFADADQGSATNGDGRRRPALDLLIWDAPNIDMTLSTVIGARPTAASRPRFDAIAAWFVEGAGDPAEPDAAEVEACVFANIPPVPGTLQRWVEALRGFGFAVFARPKQQPDDDIDQDMLDHIEARAHSHRLRRLVVFSGDGRNFADPLEQLVRDGDPGHRRGVQRGRRVRDQLGPAAVHRHRGRSGGVRRAARPGASRRPAAGRRLAAADEEPPGLRGRIHRPPHRLTGGPAVAAVMHPSGWRSGPDLSPPPDRRPMTTGAQSYIRALRRARRAAPSGHGPTATVPSAGPGSELVGSWRTAVLIGEGE
jgi:hypothetical protein